MEMGRSDNTAEAALGLGGFGCVDAGECRQAPALEQVLEQVAGAGAAALRRCRVRCRAVGACSGCSEP
jgi:hypothetical protein